MNEVYLEGRITHVEEKLHSTSEKHTLLTMEVTHRTQAGIIRREQYPVNTWRNLAVWALRNLRPGNQVLVSGYLTQRIQEQQAYTEVTAIRILPLQALPAQVLPTPAATFIPPTFPEPPKESAAEDQRPQEEGR